MIIHFEAGPKDVFYVLSIAATFLLTLWLGVKIRDNARDIKRHRKETDEQVNMLKRKICDLKYEKHKER